MRAGRGDLERALGAGLAAHVEQLGRHRRLEPGRGARARQLGGVVTGLQRGDDVEQVRRGARVDALDQRGLGGAGRRQHQAAPGLLAAQCERQRDRTAHRPQLAGQRQLAGKLGLRKAGRVDLAGSGEDAQRDRQVKARRILRQVGRCEVDRDALVVREAQRAVRKRRAHALARLAHLGVGQADQGEARQPVGQVHLDLHRRRAEPVQRAAVNHGQRHRAPPPPRHARCGRFCRRRCAAPPRSRPHLRGATPPGLDAPSWCMTVRRAFAVQLRPCAPCAPPRGAHAARGGMEAASTQASSTPPERSSP